MVTCEDARKILLTPNALEGQYRSEEISQALAHLMECNSCFLWSMRKAEEFRKERIK